MANGKIAWKRIILSLTVLGITACLFIYIFSTKGELVCKGIDIKIENSKNAKLVTPEDFRKMIERSKIAGKGKPLNDDVIKRTLKLLKSNGSVKNVLVYQTGDSILHVDVEQRIPFMRILTSSGSCYLDKESIAFPVSTRYAYDVPLITGKVQLPAEGKILKDSIFAHNLLAFVDFISKDAFWNAQIQQIDIDENRNVEFVICSDNHLIRFGQIWEYEKKLDNLLTFYRKVNPYYKEKDNVPYTILDLRFNKQIVAIKCN
jgi:cell division protein FtsQ